MPDEESLTPDEWRKLVESLPADAFDGHTEFERLSVEDRLMWLSQIARLVAARNTAV